MISAIPTDERGRPLRPGQVYPEELDEDDAVARAEAFADAGMELPQIDPSFAPAPVPAGAAALLGDMPAAEPELPAAPELTPRQRRKQLRESNTERAQELSRRTGMSHAEVNAELNRRTGIRRVSEATVVQLARRLQIAQLWLRQLRERAQAISRG